MKKSLLFLPAFLLAFSLVACGGGNGGEEPKPDPDPTPVAEKEYCLAGSFNSWAAGDKTYLLTKDAENDDHYYITGVELLAGAEFKVTDTKNNWYPDGMGNNSSVDENGVYTIDFTPSTKEIVATKTGEYDPGELEISYYVVGTFNSWAPKDDNYLMTAVADEEGKFQFTGLQLPNGAQVKVVSSLESWYGDAAGENVVAAEDGVYTVTFSLEDAEHVALTKTADWEAPEVEYFLAGSFNEWAAKDDNYKLAKVSDESYTLQMDFEANAEFKVNDSNGGWFPEANVAVEAAGHYLVDYNPTTHAVVLHEAN